MGLLTGAGNVSTYNNGTGGTSQATLAVPSNTQVDDILLLAVSTGQNSSIKPVVVTGWQQVAVGAVTGASWRIQARKAVSGDLGTNIVNGGGGNTRYAGNLVRCTGVGLPVDSAGAQGYNASTTFVTAPGLTPSVDSALVIFAVGQVSGPQAVWQKSGPASTKRAESLSSDTGTAARTEIVLFSADTVPAGVAIGDTGFTPNYGVNARLGAVAFLLPLVFARTGRPKYYNGTDWVNKPLKVNGVEKPVKYYDLASSSWKLAK